MKDAPKSLYENIEETLVWRNYTTTISLQFHRQDACAPNHSQAGCLCSKPMQRPSISDIKTATELSNWYWLKKELVAHCRLLGISYSGNKKDITDRLAQVLETGDLRTTSIPKRSTPTSSFNWTKETLTLDMIITDSYKNSQNMRYFMQSHADPKFKFNIAFMEWMKENCGKTLGDAILAYQEIELRKKDPNFKSTIPPSNEYNRYMRDFFADNPDKTIVEARHFWKLKRSLAGSNRYDRGDLDL